MFSFLFDASALAKRYTPEVGSVLVDHLIAHVALDRMYALNVGVVEVVSVIVRKRNGGRISAASAAQALTNFGPEVLHSTTFNKLEVANSLITAAVPFVITYSINATDALVLQAALDLAGLLRRVGDEFALVSSDAGLLKAAAAEGLMTFDPETQTQPDLDALIGP